MKLKYLEKSLGFDIAPKDARKDPVDTDEATILCGCAIEWLLSNTME